MSWLSIWIRVVFFDNRRWSSFLHRYRHDDRSNEIVSHSSQHHDGRTHHHYNESGPIRLLEEDAINQVWLHLTMHNSNY